MKNILVCFVLSITMSSALLPSTPTCLKDCTGTIIDSVCGSDGKTYANECTLNNAKCSDNSLVFKFKGECVPLPANCTGDGGVKPHPDAGPGPWCKMDTLEPLCASNGLAYQEKCTFGLAKCRDNSIVRLYDGWCDTGLIRSTIPTMTPTTIHRDSSQ
jgi:hypothetical protein